MKASRIVALVAGCVAALVGIALLGSAAVLGWLYATQRDDDGYFTTSRVRFETVTAALHSDNIDLGSDDRPHRWPFGDGDLATVRLRATAREGEEIFIGIAHTADVDAYLAGAAHDEVTDVDWSDDEVDYRRAGGPVGPLSAPADEDFWAASSAGPGQQTLVWDVEGGEWSIVAMSPDGSPGVAADVSIGVKVNALVWLIVGLAIGAAIMLAAAAVLIVWSTHRPSGVVAVPAPEPAAAPITPARMPVSLDARLDEPLSRGLWLVKWFLAIPHFVILVFLWIALVVTTVIAGVAIVFTGRYPRPLFQYNVGVLRWTWRVSYYATSGIGTDRYPPFTLAAVDYPATLEIEYPERLSRGLVLVKWWLLAIPHYVIVAFFVGGGWWMVRGPGLIGWMTIIAGVALLFTGRYPSGVYDFVVGMNRWVYRVIAYAALMTDRYPPFVFDGGGSEPLPPPTESDSAGPWPEPGEVSTELPTG